MNLRTLKKLSKRAAPLLPLLGDDRKQFAARKDENYTGLIISARKHWERGWSVHDEVYFDEIKTPAKNGRGWTYIKPPSHPRKGTVMVGGMEGYYEPEWSEQTAYEALRDIVFMEFTDWREESQDLTRPLHSHSLIFAAAADLIGARKIGVAA